MERIKLQPFRIIVTFDRRHDIVKPRLQPRLKQADRLRAYFIDIVMPAEILFKRSPVYIAVIIEWILEIKQIVNAAVYDLILCIKRCKIMIGLFLVRG